MSTSETTIETCRVFLCYRQVDGAEQAEWLYEHLHGRELPDVASADSEPSRLDVYFDQAAPAINDWQQYHQPALAASRAIIVVCTPGLHSRLRGEDFVHQELEWWLAQRRTAPILIDTTGSDRFVPEELHDRWPKAQRVPIDLDTLGKLDEAKAIKETKRIVDRILAGIAVSETKIKFEELEHQRRLVRRLKRALVVAVTATVTALALGGFAFLQWKEVETRKSTSFAQGLASQGALELQNLDFRRGDPELGALLVLEALERDPVNPYNQLAWLYVLDRYKARVDASLDQVFERETNSGLQTPVLDLDAEGRWIATAHDDGSVLVREVTGARRLVLDSVVSVTAITLSHTGALVAIGAKDGTVRVYDTVTEAELYTLGKSGSDPVQALAFSPDENLLAVGLARGRTQVWRGIEPVGNVEPHDIGALAFSPDGRALALTRWSSQAEEYYWDVWDWKRQLKIRGGSGDPMSVAFSPDSTRFAVGGYDGSVMLWEVGGVNDELQVDNLGEMSFPRTVRELVFLAATESEHRLAVVTADGVTIHSLVDAGSEIELLDRLDTPDGWSFAHTDRPLRYVIAGADFLRVRDSDLEEALTAAGDRLAAVELIGVTREESNRSFERNIAPHVADIRALVGRELTPSERRDYLE